jgi:hypothetical protein
MGKEFLSALAVEFDPFQFVRRQMFLLLLMSEQVAARSERQVASRSLTAELFDVQVTAFLRFPVDSSLCFDGDCSSRNRPHGIVHLDDVPVDHVTLRERLRAEIAAEKFLRHFLVFAGDVIVEVASLFERHVRALWALESAHAATMVA